MRIALVAFEGMTLLDLIGFYDPAIRLSTMGFSDELEWDMCAATATTRDQNGLQILPTMIARPLTGYDVLYVPGGFSTRTLMEDGSFLEWLRTAREAPLKISVCTGSLLLGAAGFLAGKVATTHPYAVQLLEPLCEEVSGEQISGVVPPATRYDCTLQSPSKLANQRWQVLGVSGFGRP